MLHRDPPGGSEQRSLAATCDRLGASADDAVRALQLQRGEWPFTDPSGVAALPLLGEAAALLKDEARRAVLRVSAALIVARRRARQGRRRGVGSGRADPELAEWLAGAALVLGEPWQLDLLRRQLERCLDRSGGVRRRASGPSIA
jgi:hypothetical protein